MSPAIEVCSLWKRFVLRHNRAETLKSRIMGIFDSRLRERRETFWALQDVTLSVQPGETLGLIGPNGSGKSTLLRIVARTHYPTRGTVTVRGRVSPMLEIGVGFHQELTGAENIYLSGSLLGLSRSEVDRLYPAIVEFSELEDFIDVPVKNYSSGMHARLGFSIAAHLDPDILLIDEALSVGDEGFQRKCQERMQRFRARGVTIVFVSHNMRAVASLCDRACLLVHGKVQALGPVDAVESRYQELTAALTMGAERALGPELPPRPGSLP
ncbi:MAG: ABC transporter ATP-binding protein [Armatimonadetes bacterium]|nr:ABC transporter ATP-binding protein [Armatimonadota bacterium]